MSISDERLAELDNYVCDQLARNPDGLWQDISATEAHDILAELQSLRAAAKVRAIREGDGEWQAFTADHRRHFPYPDGTEIEVTGRDTEYRSNFHTVMRVRSPQWRGHAPYIAWWRIPAASPIPTAGGEKG